MRIGFDAKRAFKNFTGLGNYSRSTIAILADYYPAHQYYLYTTPYKSHPLLNFADKENMRIRRPAGRFKCWPSLWRYYGLGGNLSSDRVDLFHGLAAELPADLPEKIRSVVTIHDLIFLRYPEYYTFIDRKIYTCKYRSACRRADLIIAISEQTKQDIMEFFGIDEQKIRVVYQGCDPQFYTQADDDAKSRVKELYRLPDNYVLYVGTIEQRKNLLSLVKAMELLPPSLKLVAAGKPTSYFHTVQEYIRQRRLEDRICFQHQVKFADLPAIYQQAQAVCYPSLFEGFGIPLLEALNSRVPLVASNCSSLPEAGGPDSLYVNPLDHEAIAEALRKAIEDETTRRQMIEVGIKFAANFREERVAKNLWKVYQELM
ncbi:MAG: glycosyltransferase family 4 protein [Bacteroidales bacterium]|nr:glycosyltransferase family 4 protein [Bacteroidales bacterium]MCL2133177.1 glycosyltransferase family 4 protein [Bacteroidales bacterium]